MKSMLIVVAFSVVLVAIEAQQFSCTSNAQFSANFDGSFGTATCSSGNSLGGRCGGCCEAWGMNQGISKDSVTGFVSSDGQRCTCCGFLRNFGG